MKLQNGFGATMLALTLVACGGGDSSPTPSGGGTVTTPPPSPPPPPPPPPPPTYTTFANLSGDQTFDSACTGYEIGFGLRTFPGTSFTNGFGITFSAASETWTIAPASAFTSFDTNLTFGPSDLQSSSTDGTASYRRTDANGQTELFRYGFASSLTPIPDYARSSQLSSILPNGARGVFRCTFGVPTDLSDDLPNVVNSSGFVSYASYSIEGDAFIQSGDGTLRQFALDRTQIDFRADPRDGSISVNVTLIGREFQSDGSLSDQETALGEIQGQTSIDGSEQNFSELINGQSADGSNLGGSFGGWFFGPQGAEVAFVFDSSANLSDGSVLVVSALVTGTGQDEFVPV